MAKAERILCDVMTPDGVLRLWDGSGGPFVDEAGNIYRSAQFTEDALQQIEAAINGEAFTLGISLGNMTSSTADELWDYDEVTPLQGSKVVIKTILLDDFHQPVGSPLVLFTGTIDNFDASDEGQTDNIQSRINLEITNRFSLRTVASGGVLSDVDQRAYSKTLNPSAPDDQFCSRVTLMRDKTITWP
ncbi:MAG: hypothetical protein ACK4SQ_15990 [Allorhizobium sp.]